MAADDLPLGFLVLALPFAAALLAAILTRPAGRAAPWVLSLLPASAFILLAREAGSISSGAVLRFGLDWVPALGIRFSFRLDGLSFVFALLISGIGALVLLFSGGYLAGDARLGRFLAFICLFMGAMLGLVLADDLVTLVVFWEATSIASFLLIGFDHERERARRGAIQALAITGAGGLALLAAVALIRATTDFRTLTDILGAGSAVLDGPAALPILLLVLLSAFTKSAQMPFHVWLPNAMEAPTPVSAYLHSATMVKAGVYLLMRLHPALGGSDLWQALLPLAGGITLVGGAILALRQSDLKLVLAYTTLASLGLLVMLVGIGTKTAIAAATLYLLAHALFKGGLFMVAGAIDHGAGTRDLRALGGLRHAMPITFAAALLGALSMAGVAPFFGFLAKEEVYAATDTLSAATLTAIAGNAMMVAAALLVALKPFLGRRLESLGHAHDGGALLLAGPLVLGSVGLALGLFSPIVHAVLTEPMAFAVAGESVAIHVSALPHLNLAFALSLLTIAIGVALFLVADLLRTRLAAGLERIGWGPDLGFDQAMRGLLRLSVAVTRLTQSGRLGRYMATAFATIALALLVPLAAHGALPSVPAFPDLSLHEWAVAGLLVAGLYAVLAARNRLTAIVSLGIQGLAVALLFVMAGAPDLSFTQFMVETLSVVVLALVMTRLNLSVSDRRPFFPGIGDAAIALACGSGFALLLLAVVERPLDTVLSDFYGRYSYAIAHGRNIVNVIIVDFRGVDTMGEIAVVMTTGLAILALVGLRAARRAEARS